MVVANYKNLGIHTMLSTRSVCVEILQSRGTVHVGPTAPLHTLKKNWKSRCLSSYLWFIYPVVQTVDVTYECNNSEILTENYLCLKTACHRLIFVTWWGRYLFVFVAFLCYTRITTGSFFLPKMWQCWKWIMHIWKQMACLHKCYYQLGVYIQWCTRISRADIIALATSFRNGSS